MKLLGKHVNVVESVHKIPSVNDMYKVGRAGKKTWIYLDPEVDKFKRLIIDRLRDQNLDLELQESYDLDKVMFKVSIGFAIIGNFWARDTTNMIKASEDALKVVLNRDDSYNIVCNSSKMINDVTDFETIVFTIEVYELDEEPLKMSNFMSE